MLKVNNKTPNYNILSLGDVLILIAMPDGVIVKKKSVEIIWNRIS